MVKEPGKFLLYSLWDRKLNEFGSIAVSKNDESAVRALRDGIRGSRSVAEQHPEDFDLMHLGEYYPETGFVAGLSGPPRLVANLQEALSDATG